MLGLIGRNGAGKSSLLKILGGLARPDDGLTSGPARACGIAFVAQEPSLDATATIFKSASEGLQRVIAIRDQYLSGAEGLDLDALQSEIEAYDAWNWEQRVEGNLAATASGSGGSGRHAVGRNQEARCLGTGAWSPARTYCCWMSRLNHLDLDSIEWLEDLLLDFPGSVL